MPGTAENDMHPDTIAALRLLALTLTVHPDDMTVLRIYGELPDHLADVAADWLDDDQDDDRGDDPGD